MHNEADAEHADIGRRLLGRFAKSEGDLERAITAATQMVLVSQVMFDGVHRCVLRVR